MDVIDTYINKTLIMGKHLVGILLIQLSHLTLVKSDSSNGCLYFTSSPSYNRVASHQSTSPMLVLQVILCVSRYYNDIIMKSVL